MKGFGERFGKVLGGFWEGFGRLLESLGPLWTLQGLFSIVSGLCWALLVLPGIFLLFLAVPGLSQPFLAFSGFCRPLLGLSACYYCGGRAKRASKASERSSLMLSLGFPCLPLLSLAYPCFLLLSVASILCMLFGIFLEWYLGVPSLILFSVSGCSLPSFAFSRFTLCQHFFNRSRFPFTR